MTKKTLLAINDLKVHFESETGVVRAVDGIDFVLKEGETVGIVGESGSGKSMTALSIMKLIPKAGKASGEVLFFGDNELKINLLNADKNQIEKIRGNEIGMIFQEPMTSLNPVFKCGKQVLEAIEKHQKVSKEDARKKVFELFEKVKLPDPNRIFDAYPHQLSGGQKQRVMIATALAGNPKILIADEPTTALDVTVQKSVLELINELKNDLNMSVIFISHDLGVIAEIADRVLVMFKGKIPESGRVADIFKNPKHPYTKSLLACRPPLEKRLEKLPVPEDFMEVSTNENGEIVIIEKESQFVENQIVNSQNVNGIKPLFRIENLKKYFPVKTNFFGKTIQHTKAVDSVNFEIFEGETMGLVGESGCGKTTLGRTILRLIEPTAGSVFYQQNDLTKIGKIELRNLRKDLQIIFQDPYSSLNPRQPIGYAILEPLKFHRLIKNEKEGEEKAIDLLETVGLEANHFFRLPHEFSGGQRQRICIARALATNPKFLVCDECVSSLDVSVQARILNLLNELKAKQNLTYVFISHDLSVVKFMSDRMMVMNKGKIEEIGDADEIYRNPKSEYTRGLIEAVPKGL